MDGRTTLGHLVKVVHREFENERNTLLRERGLTDSQVEVIEYIVGLEGGQATQCEIRDYLRASGATVSGLVTRLERKGLVERVENGADRRSNLVRVTDAARALATECEERLERVDARLTEGFTADERASLEAYLVRIVDNAG